MGHGALYVHRLYIILLVDQLLYWYGATHIQLHAAAYYCCVQFYILFLNVSPWPNFQWLQSQCRSGLTGVCIAAASQPGQHWMKRPSFGSIWVESHRAEVIVELCLGGVEKVRKMITKSGQSWAIYSKLQVTREWMTVNLQVVLKVHPPVHRCKLEVIPTVPGIAVSRSADVCSSVWGDILRWTTDDIWCLIDIPRKFFDTTVPWRCLSPHIASRSYMKHTVIILW